MQSEWRLSWRRGQGKSTKFLSDGQNQRPGDNWWSRTFWISGHSSFRFSEWKLKNLKYLQIVPIYCFDEKCWRWWWSCWWRWWLEGGWGWWWCRYGFSALILALSNLKWEWKDWTISSAAPFTKFNQDLKRESTKNKWKLGKGINGKQKKKLPIHMLRLVNIFRIFGVVRFSWSCKTCGVKLFPLCGQWPLIVVLIVIKGHPMVIHTNGLDDKSLFKITTALMLVFQVIIFCFLPIFLFSCFLI